ncbi:MAG TPA: hypothetical protein VHZ55_09675 [Bryobacteraceae bacterium]|nr:hypothetical protein [Bryobacteraceae bacterium]
MEPDSQRIYVDGHHGLHVLQRGSVLTTICIPSLRVVSVTSSGLFEKRTVELTQLLDGVGTAD